MLLLACATAEPPPPSAALVQVERAAAKPPMVHLVGTLELENPTTGPRWFVVPDDLAHPDPFDGFVVQVPPGRTRIVDVRLSTRCDGPDRIPIVTGTSVRTAAGPLDGDGPLHTSGPVEVTDPLAAMLVVDTAGPLVCRRPRKSGGRDAGADPG